MFVCRVNSTNHPIPAPSVMSTVLLPLQAAAPNSLLANLTFEPLKFGPPTTRSNAIVAKGTREVKLQPRAPSKAVTSSPAQHSIREETSISSSSTVEQEHHRDKFASHISLAWPDSVSSYNRPAAGLQNPSMACYANATLQILLHTPPVLMAALEHEINACKPPITVHDLRKVRNEQKKDSACFALSESSPTSIGHRGIKIQSSCMGISVVSLSATIRLTLKAYGRDSVRTARKIHTNSFDLLRMVCKRRKCSANPSEQSFA